MAAALDKWEEQGTVLQKDIGEEVSQTVRVGIITAMMPESIQEFVYSILGITVECDTIFAKICASVSNKVAMADGPTPMGVDNVSVDYVEVQTEYSDDDQEIDVVNMSIQCHGCGAWEHYKFKCPTAGAVMTSSVWEQWEQGSGGMRQKFGQGDRWVRQGVQRRHRQRRFSWQVF